MQARRCSTISAFFIMSSELTLHVVALAGFVLDTPQMTIEVSEDALEAQFQREIRESTYIPTRKQVRLISLLLID